MTLATTISKIHVVGPVFERHRTFFMNFSGQKGTSRMELKTKKQKGLGPSRECKISTEKHNKNQSQKEKSAV